MPGWGCQQNLDEKTTCVKVEDRKRMLRLQRILDIQLKYETDRSVQNWNN